MTNEQIATAFSGGRFNSIYAYLTADTEWNIFGDRKLAGKENIMAFCEQAAAYFAEVTTDFTLSNLVVGGNCVAIDGTAEFTTKENKKTEICSCDVYRFENGQLLQINSYCITTSKQA